jgi:hypothetical protein
LKFLFVFWGIKSGLQVTEITLWKTPIFETFFGTHDRLFGLETQSWRRSDETEQQGQQESCKAHDQTGTAASTISQN